MRAYALRKVRCHKSRDLVVVGKDLFGGVIQFLFEVSLENRNAGVRIIGNERFFSER